MLATLVMVARASPMLPNKTPFRTSNMLRPLTIITIITYSVSRRVGNDRLALALAPKNHNDVHEVKKLWRHDANKNMMHISVW